MSRIMANYDGLIARWTMNLRNKHKSRRKLQLCRHAKYVDEYATTDAAAATLINTSDAATVIDATDATNAIKATKSADAAIGVIVVL